MMKRTVLVVVMTAGAAGVLAAQGGKTDGGTRNHDVTIVADQVYTGTMAMAVNEGKVTGDLLLTSPMVIKGKVAGTARDGQLQLDFPFQITEQGCEGTVKMKIALPATPGPAKGTMAAVGCGREPGAPLEGTVELKPAATDGRKPKQD